MLGEHWLKWLGLEAQVYRRLGQNVHLMVHLAMNTVTRHIISADGRANTHHPDCLRNCGKRCGQWLRTKVQSIYVTIVSKQSIFRKLSHPSNCPLRCGRLAWRVVSEVLNIFETVDMKGDWKSNGNLHVYDSVEHKNRAPECFITDFFMVASEDNKFLLVFARDGSRRQSHRWRRYKLSTYIR